ncbi:MAG: glycosyltransferase family 39 protein [Acidobacteria bacterium]|nr:glycosyltransferase family 39 protein [Acidobacteriota bacterium]
MKKKPFLLLAGALLAIVIAQGLAWQSGEPFYNNDETRHVMTGVFVHDLLVDHPFSRLRDYTVDYYLQYPALGLIVWPPLFYGFEGVLMLVLGTSFAVTKALAGLFSALACVYLFLLVRRTHGEVAAAVVTLLFGLSPLVFLLSHHVMLEMPALAFALAAIYHFVRYLDDLDGGKRLDVFIAAAAAAGFALTRYDAFVLVLFFLLSLLALRRFDVLRRREVWLAALLALAIVLPVYVPMLAQFGRTHVLVTVEGGAHPAPGLGLFGALAFYPRALPGQIGWLTLVPALAGLLSALRPARRQACWPYLTLAAATWLAFTPLAERMPRHTIYWVPAFALFAWEGIDWIASRLKLPQGRAVLASIVASIVIGGAFWLAATSRMLYVRGYEEAARYVVANTRASRYSFVDGFLNGDFIYQVRRHDPRRRLWVLRGDKLLYGVINDPSGGYEEFAGGENQILAALFRYDPEYLVVEEPQVLFKIPMAERLRQTLAEHPERFERVKSLPIESNVPAFRGVRLDVYRSRLRNPSPERRLSLDMMGLGRSLGTEVR